METLLRIAVLALLAGMAQFAVRRAWRAAMRAFRLGRVGAGAKAILIFMAVAGMLYSGDKDAPRHLRDIHGSILHFPARFENGGGVCRAEHGGREGTAQDTDGDGMPDEWERWTGTDPLAADASRDLDGDGLANLDEYLLKCDPQCADTDSDGIGDAAEAAGLAQGIPDCDPVAPATFAADEPDTDGDGVPDIWEDSWAPLFAGLDADGFPVGFAPPAASPGNYDVLLTVTTSRHALLSWDVPDAVQSVLLPPCEGLSLRLRLDAGATRTVSLSPNPGGAAGTWRGGLAAEWDPRRSQSTDGNRVALGDGGVVDREGDAGAVFAVLGLGAGERRMAARSGGGLAPVSLSFVPSRWDAWIWPHQSCAKHGIGVTVELAGDGLGPPFVWRTWMDETGPTTNRTYFIPLEAFSFDSGVEVSVREDDGVHAELAKGCSSLVGISSCTGAVTNILPVYSLPGFDAMANHAPHVRREPIHNATGCPDGTNIVVHAGWGGNSWERNFETIPTGEPADDLTSHCLAIDWEPGLEIDLEEYLPAWLLDFREELRYRVNGENIDGGTVPVGKKPKDLLPTIFHVELLNDADITLDRLWIVVLNPGTRTEFSAWANQDSTNAAWLATLPPPPSRLIVNSGEASLPTSASANWNAPERFPPNSYMHPKAVYELRSKPVTGEHGHQATYDANGNLITESIKAGTSDCATPYPVALWWRPINHREKDVKPYIRALQLDGNPVLPMDNDGTISRNIPRNLTRPPLRVGPFTQQYLQRRPTTPTGVLSIP